MNTHDRTKLWRKPALLLLFCVAGMGRAQTREMRSSRSENHALAAARRAATPPGAGAAERYVFGRADWRWGVNPRGWRLAHSGAAAP
jgi:hypothetical protein